MLVLQLCYLQQVQKYKDPSEILDQPFNASTFPSSFYLTTRNPHYTMSLPSGPVCHPDLMNEEYMDGLSDEERESRSKHNYVYNKFGYRSYPTRDGYYANKKEEHRKDCRWKYYRGKCIVYEVVDDWYHHDHAIVKFEFRPTMAKQLASDLTEFLTIDYYNPSYDYIIERKIKVGNVYNCDKRKKLFGDCPAFEYDFLELDSVDEKIRKSKE